MSFFASRTWWVLDPGMPWEQWARVRRDGKTSFYDGTGKPILKTHYGSRHRAATSLKRRRFRKLSDREIRELQPPGSKPPADIPTPPSNLGTSAIPAWR